jgi:hypothetical protein
MTATDVRDRARSLADLPNSKLITSDDEINSINETYHDVYDWLMQNDDDYYVTEVTIALTAAMQSPTNLVNNEFWVPLPTDFYRLRYLDYAANNQWQAIDKLPMSARDISPASPQYRLRGAYLWLIGGMNIGSSYTIRLGYYPRPATITLSLPSLTFGTSYTAATLSLITEAFYTAYNQTMVYVLYGTTIVAESLTLNTVSTPTTLYSTPATTITEMQAYKGYLYWSTSTLNVYRSLANYSATLGVATAVTSSGDVTDFAIFNDTLYYTTATAMKSCTVTGASIATLAIGLNGPYAPTYIQGNIFYIDASANMRFVGGMAVSFANVGYIATDGLNLFFLDSSNNFMAASVTAGAVSVFATLSVDTRYIGHIEKNITSPISSLDQVYVPVLTRETPQFLAVGGWPPFNFTYPNNLFTEIMSYQMAIDFKTKAKQDPSMLAARMGSRDVANNCTGLWLRFYQSIKRDDYQPERINHKYQQPWGIW